MTDAHSLNRDCKAPEALMTVLFLVPPSQRYPGIGSAREEQAEQAPPRDVRSSRVNARRIARTMPWPWERGPLQMRWATESLATGSCFR